MGYKTYTCQYAKKCGGCELLAVPYELQLQRKQRAMEERHTVTAAPKQPARPEEEPAEEDGGEGSAEENPGADAGNGQ